MKKAIGLDIKDLRLFGEQEDRVVSLTEDGYVALYSLSYDQKRGVMAHHQIEMMEEREENTVSMAVDGKNQYVFVEIRGADDLLHSLFFSSRMVILKITHNYMIQTASLDQKNQGIEYKMALESCGSVKNHIFWVGLTMGQSRVLQVYDYGTETRDLVELSSMRVDQQELIPYSLHRLGEKFYYVGEYGKLMSLSVRL